MEQWNPRYFHYLFKTEKYKAEFKRSYTGIIESRLRLYPDKFFSIPAIVPTKRDQDNIVNFLDEKLTQMEALIDRYEKLFGSVDIIKQFNNRFGIDNWTDDDKVKNYLFYQLPQEMQADESTMKKINNSDKQNAKITSDKKVEDKMQEVIFQFTDLYKKLLCVAMFLLRTLSERKVWAHPATCITLKKAVRKYLYVLSGNSLVLEFILKSYFTSSKSTSVTSSSLLASFFSPVSFDGSGSVAAL
ncbi:hypothetical protein ES705_18560 [subsurface metagenome]